MQTFKKVIFSLSVFIICSLIISLPCILSYYSLVNSSNTIPKNYEKYDGKIDTLFLGSSNTRVSVDTKKYDDALGTVSYSYTSNRMYMQSNYYSFCKIIKTNNIKQVFIELSYDNLFDDPFGSVESIVNYYELLPKDSEKLSFTFKYSGINNFINVLGYSIYNGCPIFVNNQIHNAYVLYKKITTHNQFVDKNESNPDVEITQGFIPNYSDNELDITYNNYKKYYHTQSRKNTTINKNQKKYLDMILSICKEKNVDVTFVVYPNTDYFTVLYDNNYLFESASKQISNETGYKLLDFNLFKNKSELFDDFTDFYNGDHLSYSGAEKFTDILINTIQNSDYGSFFETYESREKSIICK